VKIVTICGAGIGSSGILKVNAERVLAKLGIDAVVVAADRASLATAMRDAQVVLASAEFVNSIGKTFADVIVIDNYSDAAELSAKLEQSLG